MEKPNKSRQNDIMLKEFTLKYKSKDMKLKRDRRQGVKKCFMVGILFAHHVRRAFDFLVAFLRRHDLEFHNPVCSDFLLLCHFPLSPK